jgi:hypothetical protein
MKFMEVFNRLTTGSSKNNTPLPTVEETKSIPVKDYIAEGAPSAKVASGKPTSAEMAEMRQYASNLAEFVCYYHRLGVTVEELAIEGKTDVKEISAIITEAKATRLEDGATTVYNFLADKLTEGS